MGRYMSQDPIGYLSEDFNLYRYCGNDPLNRVDPQGLFLQQLGAAFMMLGGAVTTMIGGGIVIVAAVEAESIFMVPFIPHTVGAGTTLIGAGITSMALAKQDCRVYIPKTRTRVSLSCSTL